MSTNINKNIFTAFQGHDTHHDAFLLKAALEADLAAYPLMTIPEKLAFRHDLKETWDQIIDGNFFTELNQDIDSVIEKVKTLLKAVNQYPDLMTIVNHALLDTARYDWDDRDNDLWIAAKKIPYFEIFREYPALTTGLETFVSEYLSSHSYLPQMFAQIENTPYSQLITPAVIDDYRASITCNSYGHDAGKELAILNGMASYWKMFESDPTPIFCAYTPFVAKEDLPEDPSDISDRYFVYYDADKHFLCIKFPYEPVPDTSWISNYIGSDHLRGAYILLNCALRTLNGIGNGDTTTNQDWIDLQVQYLKPVLEADVRELENVMAAHNIPLPVMQPSIRPQISNKVWAAHKGFFSGSPNP